MPFRDLKNIDEETRRNMTQAFEAACGRLGLDTDDPLKGKVAGEIVALVSLGERDPAKLFALTIEAIDSDQAD